MGKKVNNDNSRDPKKESVFKELAKQLADLGIVVRREKLKQGSGWRALSGSCQVSAGSQLGGQLGGQLSGQAGTNNSSSNFLFVDSRLSQDEQIEQLSQRLAVSNVSVEKLN